MRKKNAFFMVAKGFAGIFCALIVLFSGFCSSLCRAADTEPNRNSLGQLNSIAINPASESNNLIFTFGVKNQTHLLSDTDIKSTILKYINYFLLCLTIPDEKFWVNLDPNQPYQMIDSALVDTDIGGIMLTADLKLKKDTCELMDPQKSEAGKEFWERLYEKSGQLLASDKAIIMNRFWIAPAEVLVYETGQKLLLEKSKLRVFQEKAYPATEQKTEARLQIYAESLIKELILPALNRRINESDSYKELRSMFRALILARWYKNRIDAQQNPLLHNIDYKVVKGAERYFLFRPEQIYREYLNSFKKGEDFINGTGPFSELAITQYVLGGVDFRGLKLKKTERLDLNIGIGENVYSVSVSVPNSFEKGKNPLQIVLDTYKVIPLLPDGGKAFAANLLPPVVSFGLVERMEINVNPESDKRVLSKL